MTKNFDCYECKHRGSIPGNTHSCCNHPAIKDESIKLNVTADDHGIKKGWVIWPWNFDPIWLTNCDGFENKADKTPLSTAELEGGGI